jgi:glucoamylase
VKITRVSGWPLSRSPMGRAAVVAAGLVVACGVIVAASSGPPPAPALAQAGIAQNPCAPGQPLSVPAGTTGQFLPGSSVLRTAAGIYTGSGVGPAPTGLDACTRRAVAASRAWLAAGTVPGQAGPQRSLAIRALLDLRLLTGPDGGALAAAHTAWAYAWPRDSSWMAAALAGTGHPGQALGILRFLQRSQRPDGTWAARYHPDGSGAVADGRPAELDATGWVPWAVWTWAQAAGPDRPATRRQLALLWPMISAAAGAAARSLTADGLPAASMDYWEDSVTVTLGTAAPLLTGLRAAADLAAALVRPGPHRTWTAAATRLTTAIRAEFGRFGYHRQPRQATGSDAAVTFLGPPFGPADPALTAAVTRAQAALRLPSGGLLPGTSWPGNPDTAWTPETAFFALYWSADGQPGRADRVLSWLAAHRTTLGELPEQVSQSGQPLSVAPLGWTDAVVLLALLAQQHRLPVP